MNQMETIVQNMPGYRLNEYMIVLAPHEELRQRIGQLKKEFFEKYKGLQALWIKPQVMLARFTQYEMMEDRLFGRLKVTAMGFQPFKVDLKDYGSYPAHSIYIHVATREPVRELIRQLKDSQRLMKTDNEHKPWFAEDPQIMLVSKLVPWQYEAAWKEYSHRHFTARFVADSMLLLKRRSGDKAWQIVQRLAFQNLPVSVRQGDLFS